MTTSELCAYACWIAAAVVFFTCLPRSFLFSDVRARRSAHQARCSRCRSACCR